MFIKPFGIKLQNPFVSSGGNSLFDERVCLEPFHHVPPNETPTPNEDIYDHIRNVGKGLDDKMQELNRNLSEAENDLRKNQLVWENENCMEKQLSQRLESIQHKIWATKDLITSKENQLIMLNKDLDILVHESTDLETRCRLKEMEQVKLIRDNQSYYDKMKSKEADLERHFANSKEVKELNKAEEKMFVLKERRNALENQMDVGSFEMNSDDDKLTPDDLACLIYEEDIKQANLNQDIEVLKKKNAARKTRLMKQYKVEMTSNKGWVEKVNTLRSKVQKVKEDLMYQKKRY